VGALPEEIQLPVYISRLLLEVAFTFSEDGRTQDGMAMHDVGCAESQLCRACALKERRVICQCPDNTFFRSCSNNTRSAACTVSVCKTA
jgi:hypothetical protein